MRHYEIVLIIHPDQSTQVSTMADKYKETIQKYNGIVHRFEDWGRKQLAHYIMFNIECNKETLSKLNHNFSFNDVILRSLVTSQKKAITEPSIMMIEKQRIKGDEKTANKTKV